MNTTIPTFSDLFAQLGLPNDPWSITQFLSTHVGEAQDMRLPEAPFWTASQATFLRESLSLDSDWAVMVDQLGKALQPPTVPPTPPST